MEKIVLLEGSTINYSDMTFENLSELGEFTYYEKTEANEIADRIKDASILILNKIQLLPEHFEIAKKLKMIAKCSTGYNDVNFNETAKRNIIVSNVPGYSTFSVAQQTIAFILNLSTNIIKYNQATHDGSWTKSRSFTMSDYPTFDIKGKTLGIMGMGAIGSKVANIAEALEMNVVALARKNITYEDKYTRLLLKDFIESSDFITIHMPLTDFSNKLINKNFLSQMKSSAFIINMSRGGIVNELDLFYALKNKRIAGAAIDVMEKEPPGLNNPLLNLDNIIITPHNSWGTLESRQKLMNEVAKNISYFITGKKRNIVSL